MSQQKRKIQTVALSRNKLYKTYQFHGILGRGKNPESVMQQAVKEVFLWLQSRFRQFDSIPQEINVPDEASEYGRLLRSFRINDGYVIETVYLPEEDTWSFRLTEPDMGTSMRDALPGRLFMTNYGLARVGHTVEFGCQIVCSQPEDSTEDAEVFRPKLIRDLRESLGLFSIVDLTYEAVDINDRAGKSHYQLLKDHPERNMPIVLIEKALPDIQKFLAASGPPYRSALLPDLPVHGSIREMADRWARSLCGLAYVFVDEKARADRVVSIGASGQETTLSEGRTLPDEAGDLWKLVWTQATEHSKRNDAYRFNKVLFVDEAHERKYRTDLSRLQSEKDFGEEINTLHKRAQELEDQIVREKQLTRDFAQKYKSQQEECRVLELNHGIEMKRTLDKLQKAEGAWSMLERMIEERDRKISELQARMKRPRNMQAFIDWVEVHFQDSVILHPRAQDELKKVKNYDLDMMCDAIEVLSEAYCRRRTETLSESEYNELCKSLTATAFEISLTGDASIKRYPDDYTVQYKRGPKGKAERQTLDLHLKAGVDSQSLLRIYFFWDEETNRVVIGSMPRHLRILKGG